MQDPIQGVPSVVDFDALILEPIPINPSGGFGDVYKGWHPKEGLLAVKQLRGLGKPGSFNYTHLLHEAAVWIPVRHPNVLQCLGTWEANDTVYLVSPFLDNGTVMEYLSAHPNADRTKLILDIAKGLTYLHEIGIVHGDIKGTNVLISPTVDALVADFGLDTLADSSTITSPIDSGSLRWQSPEVLRGAAHKTFSTDVYSFGMTIYEILSGSIPFPGVNRSGIVTLVAIEKRRPEPKPKVSPTGLSYAMQWRAATRSWNDEPQRRPNMRAILSWLESEGVVRGRIRIVCEGKSQFNGYLAESGWSWEGQTDVVVTRSISKASSYQRPLKGTFPKRIRQLNYPTEPAVGSLRTRSPVNTIAIAIEPAAKPHPLSWSQAVLSRVFGRDQNIPVNARQVDLWLCSDDGELSPSKVNLEPLHPVILSGFISNKLIFCPHSDQVGHLPIRLTFEEIDSDTLF